MCKSKGQAVAQGWELQLQGWELQLQPSEQYRVNTAAFLIFVRHSLGEREHLERRYRRRQLLSCKDTQISKAIKAKCQVLGPVSKRLSENAD